MLKGFFFDRDGVLIKNYGYVHEIKKIKWLKGAIEALVFLTKRNVKIFIVTNQSGIARGYYTLKQMHLVHQYMKNTIFNRGGKINEIYYSPYYLKGSIKKFAKKSKLRKPDNGMLIKALKKYKLKSSECFMIGDSIVDQIASQKSKIRFSFKKNISLVNQVKKIYDQF